MTKWKGRAASIAPALLSVSVIALGAGLADAQTVISTELTTPQTIDVDEDVTVTSTGSVRLVGEDSEEAIDIDVEDYTSDVLIDGSLLYLGGTTVDFKDEIMGRGFVFTNPNATSSCGCGSSFSA